MTRYECGKGVSVAMEVFHPTKETPIKPSLLILMNAKDNEIIDLIYDHASLKSVQSALSDLLTTSATHDTFSRPSTKRGLISIIKLMQFTIVRFF